MKLTVKTVTGAQFGLDMDDSTKASPPLRGGRLILPPVSFPIITCSRVLGLNPITHPPLASLDIGREG